MVVARYVSRRLPFESKRADRFENPPGTTLETFNADNVPGAPYVNSTTQTFAQDRRGRALVGGEAIRVMLTNAKTLRALAPARPLVHAFLRITRGVFPVVRVVLIAALMTEALKYLVGEGRTIFSAPVALIVLAALMFAVSRWWHQRTIEGHKATIEGHAATIATHQSKLDHHNAAEASHKATIDTLNERLRLRDEEIAKLKAFAEIKPTAPAPTAAPPSEGATKQEETKPRAASEPKPSAVKPAAAAKLEADKKEAAPPPDPERVYIPLTVAKLVAPFKDHTAKQAATMVSMYLGHWLEVSGPLDNVRDGYGGVLSVSIHNPHGGDGSMHCALNCEFGPRWHDALSVLQRDALLRVRGKVEDIGTLGIDLVECELI